MPNPEGFEVVDAQPAVEGAKKGLDATVDTNAANIDGQIQAMLSKIN